jgi:hypothetical protein
MSSKRATGRVPTSLEPREFMWLAPHGRASLRTRTERPQCACAELPSVPVAGLTRPGSRPGGAPICGWVMTTVVDEHAADAAEGGALTKDPGFVDRYGPWALVAGASEGVGAAYARAIAERGLNVALLARRREVLDEVASSIRSTSGVETRTLAIDLS